jgi:hypothetical protein
MSPDARPDRHALLELLALFAQLAILRSEGDATRFATDDRYRWSLHHLAHSRLPDIDEALVQRFTWARLDPLQRVVGQHLRGRT